MTIELKQSKTRIGTQGGSILVNGKALQGYSWLGLSGKSLGLIVYFENSTGKLDARRFDDHKSFISFIKSRVNEAAA